MGSGQYVSDILKGTYNSTLKGNVERTELRGQDIQNKEGEGQEGRVSESEGEREGGRGKEKKSSFIKSRF